MKILIITDIHYGEDTNYPHHGGSEYVNCFGSEFESYVPKLQNMIREHDLVINLGDLIHETNTPEDAVEYKKAIGFLQAGKPLKSVAGNHDRNTFSQQEFAELIGEKKLYYSFDLGGYHHVILEGFREARNQPYYILPDQVAWFTKDLEDAAFPTLIYCHYPLDEQDFSSNYYFKGRENMAIISNQKEVRELLESSHKVLAVFSGHTHIYNKNMVNGIPYITVPSFTENDGNRKPKAECLSVTLEKNEVEFKIFKIS